MRDSGFRRFPLLLLAAALVALAVFFVGDNAPPVSADHEHTTIIWDATLTQPSDTSYLGCRNTTSGMECTSVLSDNNFTYDGVDYAITQVGIGNAVATIVLNKAIPAAMRSGATLWIRDVPFEFATASISNNGRTAAWGDFGTRWNSGDEVRFSLEAPRQPETLWSATLTVQARGNSATIGCSNNSPGAECSTASTLTDDDFMYGDVEYHVEVLLNDPIPSSAIRFDKGLPAALRSAGKLTINNTEYSLAGASVAQSGSQFTWVSQHRWSVGDTVTLSLKAPRPPTYGVALSTETLAITEGSAGSGTFTVALPADPGASTTVTLFKTQYNQPGIGAPRHVWDLDAADVSPETLTFTAGSSGNWGTAQTVTVTAPEDADSCHEQLVILTLSGGGPVGGGSNGVTGVHVTVTDNDGGSCGGV